MWTPIIPNTQLMIFAQGNNGEKWGIELFINPANAMYMIVISVVVILIVIGVIIIVLHC